MGEIIETGHAINISNFKLEIDKCTSFGVTYNPSNALLTIPKMTILWTKSFDAHKALTTAVQESKGPINAREILFEPVDKLVTRTLNYFESTQASAQIKKDAKGLADRFRGFGVGVDKLPDGTPDPDDVSTSHQSYVQKGDVFRQLVDLYKSDANYAPNEADITTVVLTTLSDNMKTLNDNIGTIIAPVEGLRDVRDKYLYETVIGLVDTAQACKDYVQGAFGATSPEAKSVRSIKFTRPKKKDK